MGSTPHKNLPYIDLWVCYLPESLFAVIMAKQHQWLHWRDMHISLSQ